MIITLNPATLGGQPPLKEYIALAQKYGFGGVEIGIEEVVRLGQSTTLADVKALFDSAGVIPVSFGLPVDWRKDDGTFQDGLGQLPELARAAQEIGCARVCTWLPPAIKDDPLHFRNLARDRFRQIATVVGDHGIRFGLEWVGPRTLRHGPGAMGPNEFIYNMPATLELIADIDSPHDNVGLLADSFHWFTTGATVGDIEALRPEQIVHVHINDAPDKPRDEQMDFERLLPGEGVIDLPDFLGALRRIGYDGPVAVETFNKALSALGPDEAARRTGDAAQTVLPQAMTSENTPMDDRQYFQSIFDAVRAIPTGQVMSYGQVGREIGCSARIVGWAMANALEGDVPWQRVVGADGYLRIGKRSVALQEAQRKLLEREGVSFKENGCVDMTRHQVGLEPKRETRVLVFEFAHPEQTHK